MLRLGMFDGRGFHPFHLNINKLTTGLKVKATGESKLMLALLNSGKTLQNSFISFIEWTE